MVLSCPGSYCGLVDFDRLLGDQNPMRLFTRNGNVAYGKKSRYLKNFLMRCVMTSFPLLNNRCHNILPSSWNPRANNALGTVERRGVNPIFEDDACSLLLVFLSLIGKFVALCHWCWCWCFGFWVFVAFLVSEKRRARRFSQCIVRPFTDNRLWVAPLLNAELFIYEGFTLLEGLNAVQPPMFSFWG
ncbi:hypothetical protein BDN70DRAFT_547426 [Pholiota conissans]|uniref:Uncharacterized protein n=1 Tax=Pholiota conissans TaxID=109636 RepID=A0A9P5YQ83_9AGAR|nr:hypothetical protein BDN70DRAFT_547426 [Pholiota conissans]